MELQRKCGHFQMTTSKLKNNNHVVEKMLHILYAEDILRNPYPGTHHVLANMWCLGLFIKGATPLQNHIIYTFKLYPGTVAKLFTLYYTWGISTWVNSKFCDIIVIILSVTRCWRIDNLAKFRLVLRKATT